MHSPYEGHPRLGSRSPWSQLRMPRRFIRAWQTATRKGQRGGVMAGILCSLLWHSNRIGTQVSSAPAGDFGEFGEESSGDLEHVQRSVYPSQLGSPVAAVREPMTKVQNRPKLGHC